MNKKEFELIAEVIHRCSTANSLERNAVKREARRRALQLVVGDLTGTLAHEYKTFDQIKFQKACGLE